MTKKQPQCTHWSKQAGLPEFDGLSRLGWIETHWQSLVVAPDKMELFDSKASGAHTYAGVYFHWNFVDNGALVYVGRANDISVRMPHHTRQLSFTTFKFGAIGIDCVGAIDWWLDSIECCYIQALNPPNNRKFERGRWGDSQKMVDAIREAWKPFKWQDGYYRTASSMVAAAIELPKLKATYPRLFEGR